jgi:hypothetical protein
MNNQVTCPFCDQPIKADEKLHLTDQHQKMNPNITDVDVKLAQHMMKLEQRIKSLESH